MQIITHSQTEKNNQPEKVISVISIVTNIHKISNILK